MEVACTVLTKQKVAKGGVVERKEKRNKDTKDMQEPEKEIWATKPKDKKA